MNVFRLHSNEYGGTFELRGSPEWQAALTLPGLDVVVAIDGSGYGFGRGVSDLFIAIADDWRGWDGERGWGTLEGECSLAASHDGLGHVTIQCVLHSGLYESDWRVEAPIMLDAGGLDRVARDARAFDASAWG